MLIHLAIGSILYITQLNAKIIKPETKTIPIELSIKEIVIEKPKPIVQNITSKQKNKPTRLPGDRAKPSITSKQEPFYPKNAINETLEGKVTVRVTINTRGRISKIKVIRSSGHEILDQAFIQTIKSHYKFKPKRVMGVNKMSTVTLSYRFTL